MTLLLGIATNVAISSMARITEIAITRSSDKPAGPRFEDWVAEMDRGQPVLDEYRAKLAETQIEQVGARLRALNVREEAAEVHGVG